jgi:hypothetical protein
VAAVLRSGNAPGSAGATGILRRLIARVCDAFPDNGLRRGLRSLSAPGIKHGNTPYPRRSRDFPGRHLVEKWNPGVGSTEANFGPSGSGIRI